MNTSFTHFRSPSRTAGSARPAEPLRLRRTGAALLALAIAAALAAPGAEGHFPSRITPEVPLTGEARETTAPRVAVRAGTARIRDGRARVGVSCSTSTGQGCRGSLLVLWRNRAIDEVDFDLSEGLAGETRVHEVAIRVSSKLAARASRRRGVKVHVYASGYDSLGRLGEHGATLRLQGG